MTALVFIGFLGVFAYHCMAIYKEFRGSSKLAKETAGFAGIFGYTCYYGFLIWSFWLFDWWMPIVTYVLGIIVSGISGIFFQRNLWGMMMSPLCVLVFWVLSLIFMI